jgi:hypothetical protein
MGYWQRRHLRGAGGLLPPKGKKKRKKRNKGKKKERKRETKNNV